MFDRTTDELTDWMNRSYSHPEITLAVHSYLRYRGRVTMRQICQDSQVLTLFAKEIDLLGWRNFTEARLPKSLFVIQEAWLKASGTILSIESWAKQLLLRIINITHKQWLYRNSRIHIKHVEGLTLIDHKRIMNHTRTLIATDPMDLLPQHRSLLYTDYETLGNGPTLARQYWIAQMESALNARKRKDNGMVVVNNDEKRRRLH